MTVPHTGLAESSLTLSGMLEALDAGLATPNNGDLGHLRRAHG